LSGAGAAPFVHPRLEVEGEHPGKMRLNPRPCSPFAQTVMLRQRLRLARLQVGGPRNRISARPFGSTRQICGSWSPMRWATARMVSSFGPISTAITLTVGATSSRHFANRGLPDLRIGAITAGIALGRRIDVICNSPYRQSIRQR
jgi:hypothetical protein